jgi:hypothetical protein
MNAISCPVTRAENNAAAHIERKQSKHEAAFVLLANEFENAMRADLKTAMVSTPGWPKLATPLVDVVSDLFAAKDGDDVLLELLTLVREAAKGRDVMTRAQCWIAARAGAHAAWHSADLVSNWSEA